MICKVRATVERYDMLSQGDTVIVGVSGGADSTSLLYALCELKNDYDLKLIVAHVNHCLRGEAADADEVFVSDMCNRLGVELRILRADVRGEAQKNGMGIEECGRKVRYDFFNSIEQGAKIATAHTLSDKTETMLFNLTRGSVLRGLCGIPAKRDNIIRPLIDCTRADVEHFCEENGIDYVTDSTNLECDCSRNRIRLLVVPELKKINPSLESAVLRCTDSLSEDEAFLSGLATDLLAAAKTKQGYSAAQLAAAQIPVRKRALASLLADYVGTIPTGRQLELIDGLLLSEGVVQLDGGVSVAVRHGELLFPKASNDINYWSAEIDNNCAKLPFGRAKIDIINNLDDKNTQLINKKLLEIRFDYDKIFGELYFRCRMDGDRIRLNGRNCTKTLKKLFNESKIPAEMRNRRVLLCDDIGIVWIEGFGCDERCALDGGTLNIAEIHIERE